ncbi:MAG: DUF554 domain-containing protein [Clostridia bacterium]|nr:DUF554 domain-containing protein [Clostridia bacterium]
MWKYFGTFVNALTVLMGSSIGLMLRKRNSGAGGKESIREPLPETMMCCLGLCTIFAAASGLLGVESGTQAIVVVASMVGGLLIGYWLRIDDRINGLGDRLVEKTGGAQGVSNPAAGFVTACMLFCIGSMTILGAFEGARSGAGGLDLNCHTTLLIKSLLDLVSSSCLAVTYGLSVMASVVFVILFQGGLTLLASFIQPFLMEINALPMVNCVGSLMLLCIAMNLLGLRKTKTADYLPAIFLPILICWILSLFGIRL